MKKMIKIKIVSLGILLSTSILSTTAMARLGDENDFSMDIPVVPMRTEQNIIKDRDYSLMTVNLGGEIEGYYDSNIFKSPTDEEGDFVTVINPGISFETDFENHGFDAYAEIESVFHLDNDDNNYTNLEFGADGYYTLNDTYALFGDVTLGRYHSSIGSFIDDPSSGLSEPVSYFNAETEAGVMALFQSWFGSLSGLWDTYDYDNTARRNGTISIEDDRDRDEYGLNLKFGREISAYHTVYLDGRLNDIAYDNRIDSSAAFTRDSNGGALYGGLAFENKAISGDIALGFVHQDYDANQLSDITEPAFMVEGTWDITPQDELRLQGDTRIRETTSTGVSGYIQNRIRINYTHDIDDISSVGIKTQYARNDFETNNAITALTRQDDIVEAEIWGEREIYDRVDVNISYTYRDRESNSAGADYQAHIFGARLIFDY